ncbi:MAG: hypothetical protein QOD72_2808 [Acidimicrobiaceae bacterium]|jgi:hypothetical protein|nr:hypothetical protein [Acidimicrobiaceae bacterium]
MSDKQFGIAATTTACVTTAAVAIHNGLGVWQTLMWVGVALLGCAVVSASIFIANRLVPDPVDLRQINLYKPVGGVILGLGVFILGLINVDVTLIGWGVGLVAVFGLLGVWIIRRPRS